ncbi:uncharacterized protein PGTG_22276 [Puccinia graminis f. sp. tritici CRL 75-36-700-3]|uniref:Uncharacterized protein n=1 Tax=Puccinia graminis f. sp. tritici (strain CRL 75-36-700-3 / race SCCL) TaxID=418459 RepID=H6QU49_PUCGT|nr:uncharacterized protein PGTG_22276 [Puccinia graminis f. sp. tritici CRL 75-36-700-3]EHS64463.1 hypothetical protein PGTG_22276 [Puccinia graminis f. sp. tritici CRL 75-36-700-3]
MPAPNGRRCWSDYLLRQIVSDLFHSLVPAGRGISWTQSQGRQLPGQVRAG